ncbi:triose-phosphate transporter family-domain-containing protein [Xylariomycetidae sp. FL2044]|nr:triose-phosphate transporter family-domain-containing protein [Xylariomycetidae sp. FL2044]
MTMIMSSPAIPELSPSDVIHHQPSHAMDDGHSNKRTGLRQQRDLRRRLTPGEQSISSPSVNHEDTVSLQKKLGALAGYFMCNIGLTIYNKAILGSFRFPWLLTALHSGSSAVGCTVMLKLGVFRAPRLGRKEQLALVLFSTLFTLNIAVSNVSLARVSVPFHQVVRATTPLFTTLLFRGLYGRTFSRATCLSLVPVVLGVSLATHGELSWTDVGFVLTLLGVLLAALKTIMTNRFMTGTLALSFWEVLLWMSPLAFIQSILYALVTGELSEFAAFVRGELPSSAGAAMSLWQFIPIVAGNGALAFALNVSSFSTNRVVGALTMTVCANVKQCLTIILGGLLFETQLSALNIWGVVVTLAGGAVYSYVELDTKRRKKR